jgi:hypothetical protein
LTTFDFNRYLEDPDPVVSALAKAGVEAKAAREASVAEGLASQIQMLTSPGYGLYVAVREARQFIDQFRYDHGHRLSEMKYGGENGDEKLANLSNRLMAAAAEHRDAMGWNRDRT